MSWRLTLRAWIFFIGFLPAIYLLGGCGEGDEGYVELRFAAKTNEQPLYLGSVNLGKLNRPNVLLTVATGDIYLTGSGTFPQKYCQIRVRKNRIAKVSVRIVDQRPRCDCDILMSDSTADMPVCG